MAAVGRSSARSPGTRSHRCTLAARHRGTSSHPIMVRHKNRYMVFELMWKDGKVDDSISAWVAAHTDQRPRACAPAHAKRAAAALGWGGADGCSWLRRGAGVPAAALPANQPRCPAGPLGRTGEAVLLAVFRESIQQNFGDFGLGSALASFQGAAPTGHRPPVRAACLLSRAAKPPPARAEVIAPAAPYFHCSQILQPSDAAVRATLRAGRVPPGGRPPQPAGSTALAGPLLLQPPNCRRIPAWRPGCLLSC